MKMIKIVELVIIIQKDLQNLYDELKEFPKTNYNEIDFMEKAKSTLLNLFGNLINI